MESIKSGLINSFCFCFLIYFSFLSWHHLVLSTPKFGSDYATFYYSLRDQHSVYEKHIAQVNAQAVDGTNFNTPTMNLILKSLVNVSNQLSINALLWTAVSFLGASLGILCMLKYLYNDYRYFLPSLVLFLLTWPSFNNIILGQVSFIVLPFLTFSFLLGYYKRWLWMAVVLAFLASIKLFFLLFLIFFLVRKEWKAALLFAVLFLVFFFLPLLYFSVKDYAAFFQIAMTPIGIFDRSTRLENGSLLGFITTIVWLSAVKGQILQIAPVRYVYILISTYVVARWMIYYRSYLSKLSAFEYELSFSFIVILSLLLSPLAWIYYEVFFLIPAVVFLKIAKQYALSISFYICFSLALFFSCLVGVPVLIVAHFCVFVNLLLWIACAVLVAQSVMQSHQTHTHSFKLSYYLLIANALLTAILLLANYGMTDFI